MTLTIYDAGADTAYARLTMSGAGTVTCAAYLIGSTVSIVLPDGNQYNFNRVGSSGLRLAGDTITLWKR